MILVVIMGIAIYVLLIWGERYIEQNKIIKRILAIFTVVILLIDYVKNRFKKREGSILLLFDWIFGGIMCDKRYWGQIAEFKADRIAVDYVSGGREAFVNFWLTETKVQREDDSTQKISRENVAYKYYKRNIEIEEHPSKKRRRKLIEERGKWEWWEYFEHVLVIRKWRWHGLGWNGVLKV